MDKFTNQLLNTKVENKKSFEKLAEVNVPSQSATNTLDNLNLENALRLANKKVKVLKTDEAKQIYKDILSKFPQNKRAQEGLKACINFGVKKWLKAMYIIATISEFNIINFT